MLLFNALNDQIISSRISVLSSQIHCRSRIYALPVLRKAVDMYLARMITAPRLRLGEVDHPDADAPEDVYKSITIARASHEVLDITWAVDAHKKTVLKGVIRLLDSPCGTLVKELYAAGQVVGISLRGWSSVDGPYVLGDLQIICFDLVPKPAVSAAVLTPVALADLAPEVRALLRRGDEHPSGASPDVPPDVVARLTLDQKWAPPREADLSTPSRAASCGCFGGWRKRRRRGYHVKVVPGELSDESSADPGPTGRAQLGKFNSVRRKSYEEEAWREGSPIARRISDLVRSFQAQAHVNIAMELGV